jgi:hypothetical protein
VKSSLVMTSRKAVVFETGSMEGKLPSQRRRLDGRKDKRYFLVCRRCLRVLQETIGLGNLDQNN